MVETDIHKKELFKLFT